MIDSRSVQSIVEESEFGTLAYNDRCSIDFDGRDILVRYNGLAKSPVIVGKYNEEDESFYFETTIKFSSWTAEDDGFGKFGYVSEAIGNLVELANYLNTHTFYVSEED